MAGHMGAHALGHTASPRGEGEAEVEDGPEAGPPLSVATNGFRAPPRTGGSESGESTAEIATGKALPLTPDSEGAKSPHAAAALVLALD